MLNEPDLKLLGLCTLNDRPIRCAECGSTTGLELTTRGPRETWPAFLSCLACGEGNDHPLITNGLVREAVAASTGRKRAEDRDTFRAEWRGLVLAGEQIPQFVLDDAVQGGKALADELKTRAKEQTDEATDRTRTWWGGKKKAARAAAEQKAGSAKAAALGAAWQMQTGGAGPQKKPRGHRCPVKGCRRGTVTVTTRIHGAKPGATRKEQVPCSVCQRRAGA